MVITGVSNVEFPSTNSVKQPSATDQDMTCMTRTSCSFIGPMAPFRLFVRDKDHPRHDDNHVKLAPLTTDHNTKVSLVIKQIYIMYVIPLNNQHLTGITMGNDMISPRCSLHIATPSRPHHLRSENQSILDPWDGTG